MATINAAVGSIGFIFLIQYFAQISGIIHRKSKHSRRKFIIKTRMKQIPTIVDKINETIEKMKNKNTNEKKLEMLYRDLFECKDLPAMVEYTYAETEKKMNLLLNLCDKYLPDYEESD